MIRTRGFRIRFSCAHFYRQEKWNDQKNRDTFGLCFTEHGHGHDYVLWVELNEASLPPSEMLQAGLEALRKMLDHQHLNHVIPEFKHQVPTTENLALYCERFLSQQWQQKPLKLTLFETPDLGAAT